ncbi:MAG: hypothetical protein AB8G05_19130 [Oligoflexales bacterium]
MISDSWTKNLANWRWRVGENQWDHSPGLNPQRLYQSFERLTELTKQACEGFNQHSTSQRQIRFMAGPVEIAKDSGSFSLLLGRCDARMTLSGNTLTANIATTERFSRSMNYSESFSAHVGNLAEISWKHSDGFLYTEELISMLMLEALVKTWWNYQGSRLEKTKSRKEDAREYHL